MGNVVSKYCLENDAHILPPTSLILVVIWIFTIASECVYYQKKTNWQAEAKTYRDLIIRKLESFGLEGLEKSIEFEQTITPADFEKKYAANKGSIYGVSSNGIFSAFLRPPNRAGDIENLYFVGGATHPGGGIPLVLLSGKFAADLILRES